MADDHEAQDVKPDAKDGTINIKVRGQDQTLLQFKVPITDCHSFLHRLHCHVVDCPALTDRLNGL